MVIHTTFHALGIHFNLIDSCSESTTKLKYIFSPLFVLFSIFVLCQFKKEKSLTSIIYREMIEICNGKGLTGAFIIIIGGK